jgi:hypothetical protein
LNVTAGDCCGICQGAGAGAEAGAGLEPARLRVAGSLRSAWRPAGLEECCERGSDDGVGGGDAEVRMVMGGGLRLGDGRAGLRGLRGRGRADRTVRVR